MSKEQEEIAKVIYGNIIEYGRQAMPPNWKEFKKTPEGLAFIRSIATSQLSALQGKGEGELPEFLVVKDSDNHYFIWPKNRYNKYVANVVDVGACPAVKIIVGFNGNEDFLFPATTLPPAGQPTGMRWVKASIEEILRWVTDNEDRLLTFKSNGMNFTGWYDSKEGVFFDVLDGKFPIKDVYILDETPPTYGKEDEE